MNSFITSIIFKNIFIYLFITLVSYSYHKYYCFAVSRCRCLPNTYRPIEMYCVCVFCFLVNINVLMLNILKVKRNYHLLEGSRIRRPGSPGAPGVCLCRWQSPEGSRIRTIGNIVIKGADGDSGRQIKPRPNQTYIPFLNGPSTLINTPNHQMW